MGANSPQDGHPGIAGDDGKGGLQPPVQAVDGAHPAGESAQTRELWILIFKGHPRDIQSARVTDLYLEVNDDNSNNSSNSNCTFRLEGQPGGYWVSEERNQPEPRFRSHFYQKLHVATLQSDSTLRNAVNDVPLRHNESDFNCQTWVGDVIEKLQTDGLISSGDAVVDAMVKSIYQAPWE